MSNRRPVLVDHLMTIYDLEAFKKQLIYEIKSLLKEYHGQPSKKWLKSKDVRKLLNISPGTLQQLRNSGKFPFTRIGGVIYYDAEDLDKIMSKKVQI